MRPSMRESTALGAAYAAGLATGVWSDTNELILMHSDFTVFEPALSTESRDCKVQWWRRAVERSLDWEYKEEAAMPSSSSKQSASLQ